MPTLRERKNPGAGTKVDLGKKAPVSQETAGLVESESLAAESYEHEGEFSENRNAQPEGVSGSGQSEVGGRKEASGRQKASSAADQHSTDTKGHHGKKSKEGLSDKTDEKNDGLARALRAEPGSEDDPSRLAERQMLQRQSLGARGAGPRQGELAGETMYDALDNEVSL
ncbi:hypothetical protein ACSS6W_009724 [Trichoderma asperelloides]|nr:hypothetical protein LI328DRAFT_126560 [Trichoderma asperelloides]